MRPEDWSGRLAVLDTETTGIDTENDRIIQAFVGFMGPDGEWIEKREWLIDPGVDVPEGASNVHGYTTERLRAEGRKDWERCIQEIEGTVLSFTGAKTPLVAYNASFDLSILDAEMRRVGYSWSLSGDVHNVGFGEFPLFVVDPLIIDKHKDKYRKGSRKLVDVAPHYDVPVEENAHDAGADCLMAGRIALKQLSGYRKSLADLQDLQAQAAVEQRTSLEEYFAKTGKTNDDGSPIVIDKGWPWYSHVRNFWD